MIQVLRKYFFRERILQVLITNSAWELGATKLKYWFDRIEYRHLRTVLGSSCSNGTGKNLLCANPRKLRHVVTFIENFLMRYQKASHESTNEILMTTMHIEMS